MEFAIHFHYNGVQIISLMPNSIIPLKQSMLYIILDSIIMFVCSDVFPGLCTRMHEKQRKSAKHDTEDELCTIQVDQWDVISGVYL